MRLATRNDFNPVFVMTLIQNNEIKTRKEALSILEEACHAMVQLFNREEQIKNWFNSAPWASKY